MSDTSPSADGSGTAADIEDLMDRLDGLVAQLDALGGEAGDTARSLAETLYLVHRSAVGHLTEVLGTDEVARLEQRHPAIAWLFDVYRTDLDEITAEDTANSSSPAQPPPGARSLPVVSAGSPG